MSYSLGVFGAFAGVFFAVVDFLAFGALGFPAGLLWAAASALRAFSPSLTRKSRIASFIIVETTARWPLDSFGSGVWTVTAAALDKSGNETAYTFRWQYTAGEARPGYSVTHYG